MPGTKYSVKGEKSRDGWAGSFCFSFVLFLGITSFAYRSRVFPSFLPLNRFCYRLADLGRFRLATDVSGAWAVG
jgi:hypothetical protein